MFLLFLWLYCTIGCFLLCVVLAPRLLSVSDASRERKRAATPTGVCEKNTPFRRASALQNSSINSCPATDFGVSQANLSKGLLLQRSVFSQTPVLCISISTLKCTSAVSLRISLVFHRPLRLFASHLHPGKESEPLYIIWGIYIYIYIYCLHNT